MGWLKCLLGFHDWVHNTIALRMGTVRVCRRCNRAETAGYDMGYGETTWRRMR